MGGVVMHCFARRSLGEGGTRLPLLRYLSAASAGEKGLPACAFSGVPVKVFFTTTFVIPEMLCVRQCKNRLVIYIQQITDLV